jgi:mono/diheme cytochrome c family protein
MNKQIPSLLIVSLAAASVLGLTACNRETAVDPVARGRHIVENVAMCVDCHTPHLPDGRLDPEKTLQGSPLPFAATVPMPWAPTAPAIAGLPTYPDDEAAIRFLTTGQTNHGAPPRPPMPSYRMTRDEAVAVVAYLRSLTTGKP